MSLRTPPLDADSPWLAPLAGYSDLPFRLLCRRHGAAVACTEMVSAKGLAQGNRPTRALLRTCPEDGPLVVQLFGRDPDVMRAVMRGLADEYPWFDCNMGCPVPKVMKTGCGAAMLADIDNAAAVARAMIEVAGPGRVGFKLRLGPREAPGAHLTLALRLQDMGAGWIALHPRTAREGYGGAADVEALRECAAALSIPVLASGDIFTPEDGARRLAECGAAGVMFARGALRDPCVFDKFRALRRTGAYAQTASADLAALVAEHIALEREWGCARSALFKMRALAARYVRHIAGSRLLRQRLTQSRSFEELEETLAAFLIAAEAADKSGDIDSRTASV